MKCDILLVCCHVLLCTKDFKAHIPYSLYGVRDQGPLTTRPRGIRGIGEGNEEYGRENKMCQPVRRVKCSIFKVKLLRNGESMERGKRRLRGRGRERGRDDRNINMQGMKV